MKTAAIDIGSNSIKLLIAEPGPRGTLIPIRREKEIVRLGHETLLTGHLSQDAIQRASQTIGMLKSISQASGAERIIAIATASVREAKNSREFIREVFNATGVRVEVLSGVEEARLIGIAASFSNRQHKSILNIDIGGGSTEISLMKQSKRSIATAKALHSMKIGAVRLSEQYISSDPPKVKELEAMSHEIEGALERPIRQLRGLDWDITTGTSGTILAIGAALQLTQYPDKESSAALPSFAIKRDELAKFNAHLASISVAARRKLPGISEQRAEIIVAGGQILEQTIRALKVKQLVTCEWSLREGIIIDRSPELQTTRKSMTESEQRLTGAEALGLRFGYEEAHGLQVERLSQKLFDQLASLHKLGMQERTLLSAAALLHDIGYAVSHESHHKHSLYIILNSELTGFTDQERLIIANIARYHRKALPKESHPHWPVLSDAEKQLVWKLAGILRIADALDRSHQSLIRNLSCKLTKAGLQISITSKRNCPHERWAVENKKLVFEQVFNVPVEVVRR